ncbi:MAG: hypothetical protein AAB263_19510 [Planctomycetota bacterium]
MDLYGQVSAAMRADNLESGAAILHTIDQEIELSKTQIPVPEAEALLRACDEARQEAMNEAIAARDRLRQAAYRELHTGQAGQRAYSGDNEQPDPRFIDHAG